MDRKNPRKFKSWNALQLAIKKSEISYHGSLGTLLLETFLENSGRFLASSVYARGLCEEKDFRNWRKNLIDKGWLVWSESQDDKGQYCAGKKLIPYLNREKMASKEIVTKNEVLSKNEAATKVEVQILRDEIRQVKSSMEKVYDQLGLGPLDPPGYSKLVDHTGTVKVN